MSTTPTTPGQTAGPFFHYALPYDGDHLLVPPGSPGATWLHGTVRDGEGAPVPDALVEVWQSDAAGEVPRLTGSLRRDGRSFTGFGRCATDAEGRYGFSTLVPGTPFFAVAVFARGLLHRLATRAYLPGSSDALLEALPPERRATLMTTEDAHGLRFDVHLQGPHETVFLTYPGERA